MKKSILKNKSVQTLIASLICIILGLFLGFVALLIINPAGAWGSITEVVKNFFHFKNATARLKYFGNTLSKTAPLLMCGLSILFAYKVGLFNIGCSGQYCAGICACLYAALKWHWGWVGCLLIAIIAGAVVASIVGVLKAYCNVNEVISGIMLNWIVLYGTNAILTNVKEPTSPYTFTLKSQGAQALLPRAGLDKLFANNEYITIAIPLALIIAIAVKIVLDKTKLGYELKATGCNKFAAKYCGMAEKKNIILTLVISGALAGLAASFYYQTGYIQWQCSTASVPSMGFNGIAATFLGGLSPIGTILASFFIQHITDGGVYVDRSMYCSQISDLISSIIIYLCGFVLFIKLSLDKLAAKKEGGKN